MVVHEQHARQVGSNPADLGLVVEVAMGSGPGSPDVYEEVMSVIGNALQIYRSCERLSMLDSRPAVKEPVMALRRRWP